jgi:chemotaxis protein MotB
MDFNKLDEFESRKNNNDGWMVIFADLLALILTFFVLLYSMSSVQVSEWKILVASLSNHLNPERAQIDVKKWEAIERALVKEKEGFEFSYLKQVFDEKIKENSILRRSTITVLDDRMAISLPADLMFTKGSSVLNDDAKSALLVLGDSLRLLKNKIVVVGHSDLEAVSGKTYPSNWELSLVRAISVANMIKESGYLDAIETYGNGTSRFKELSSEIPLHERYRMSRRVDVIIRKTDRMGRNVGGLL